MKKTAFFILFISIWVLPFPAWAEKNPKIAVWDLEARNIPGTYAQELTSILVSEITKLKKYEVYSQENVRTLAGWTAERMKLGYTDEQILLALGQMDIAKIIYGSVGKIGNRYSISLHLFDTQKAKAENAVSEFCQTEDELIELVQQAVHKLLEASIIQASSKEESNPANLSSRTIYLGRVQYTQAPKTFTLELPEDFTKVEIGVYQEGDDTPHSYCGWEAWLKVNGRSVWEFRRWDKQEGGVFVDYTHGEQEVREVAGRGKYLDVTSFFKAGSNQITYYHFNEGPGINVKVRIY